MIATGVNGSQHHAAADHAGSAGPLGHIVLNGLRLRIEGPHQSELAGVLRVDLKSIAGVVAVQGKGRDEYGSVNPHGIHCRHHIVAGNLLRSLEVSSPGAFRCVSQIGMHLAVDGQILSRHYFFPPQIMVSLSN